MSGESPAAVLYSSDGVELNVVSGAIVPTNTRALLISGRNPAGDALYVPTGIEGNLGVAIMSDGYYVQSAATVTTSGSALVTLNYFGTQEIALVVNVGTVTGAGSITYTIQELDPGDGVTVYGNSASTATITSGNAPGVFTAVLPVTTSPSVRVSWTVTGTFSATIYSTVTTKSTPSTQTVNGTVNVGTVSGTVTVTGTVAVTQSTSPWVVSGTVTANQGTPNTLSEAWPITITDGYGNIQGSAANPIWIQGMISATNPSVGSDGAAALAYDTQVGGKTTTAAPTYTNGNLDVLSLTTLGGLRIDGVYAGGSSTATAADLMANGAYVTQVAPSYSDSTLRALSLDLFGNLRTLADGYVTTSAPTYTNNTPAALSLDTSGNLRVTGTGGTFNNQSVGTDGAAALGFDTQVGAKVVTAVPTYSAGNLQALTMDVGGNLRVVTNKASTSSVTSVTATTSSQTLLAANLNRVFAAVYNGGSRNAYVLLGSGTASATNYTIVLLTGSYWEIPVDYIGQINVIWSSSGASALTGSALVTELTP